MLIRCPECGHDVSDKAATCPNCGIQIAGYITHPDGMLQPNGASGSSVASANKSVKDGKKKSGGKGKWILLLISFIIALGLCGVGYFYYLDAMKQKEEAAFQDALESHNQETMQIYLAKYKDAPAEHRAKIDSCLTAIMQSDLDWNNASISATKRALEEYIKNHPDSPHKAEALNKIDSIDYATATRLNTKESLAEYLQQHPDSRHSVDVQEKLKELQETEVSDEEKELVRTTCRHFFQAINSKNEDKLLDTVTETLSSFLGRTNASSGDVVTYMRKIYSAPDIQNMNWYMLDDFKIEKAKDDLGDVVLKTQFSAEQRIERTDPSKEKYGKYIIAAEVTKEGKITRLNMRKQRLSE